MLDLFASPGTLIPIVAGLSSLMFSWAIGGDAMANAIGIVGVLGGVGHFASRLVLGLEDMTQRAYDAILDKHQQEQDRALDDLQERLKGDEDDRTETCLRELRRLYEAFRSGCSAGQMAGTYHQVVSQVEQIFRASVEQLQRSLQLYELSEKLSGQARMDILDERERVIQEVIETRGHLGRTIEQFQTFATRRDQSELSRLRDELDETLQVAQKTEQRMASFGQKEAVYDESEFE
jgi:hypothetical protein